MSSAEATPAARLIEQVAQATVYDLGRPMTNGMAQSPNHPPFRHCLDRRHGDRVRADGGSAAADLITTGCHVGTHVDALAHVSHQGRLFGGVDAGEAQVRRPLRRPGHRRAGPVRRPGRAAGHPRRAGCGLLRRRPGDHRGRTGGGGRAPGHSGAVRRRCAGAQRLGDPLRRCRALPGSRLGSSRRGRGRRTLAGRPGGRPGRCRHPGLRVHTRRRGPCAPARSPGAAGGARRQHHRDHGSRGPGRRRGPRVRVRAGPPQHRGRHRGAGPPLAIA